MFLFCVVSADCRPTVLFLCIKCTFISLSFTASFLKVVKILNDVMYVEGNNIFSVYVDHNMDGIIICP